jgi:hypothetical protein
MQRTPAFAAGQCGVGVARALQGHVGVEHHHRVQRRVQTLDAAQVVLQQL